MVDRIAEEGAIQYAQQSTADVGTVSRLAGAGQIEADMIRLVVDGFYTQKVSGLSVRGRIINKMIDAGFLPKKRYNFTDESKTLDSSITFSRTSNATVTDSDGFIKYAAHNLLTFSENFDNAAWTTLGLSVSANQANGNNGYLTADRITEDTSSNPHRIFNTSPVSISGTVTASVYAKRGAGTRYLTVSISGSAATDYVGVTFDLNGAGTVTQTLSNNYSSITSSIQLVNEGLYRVVVTGTGTNPTAYVHLSMADSTTYVNSSRGSQSYTGNGTASIFIWGAQLTQLPCVSTDYVSTSPANLLGFTEEFDNAAWTKSNSFVQTNLLTYSEQFDNAAWTKSNSSITANSIAAPNGTLTADKLVEDATANNHSVRNPTTVVSGISYTASAYFKAAERTQASIEIFTGASVYKAVFDLSNGTFISSTGTGSYVISSVGNGWYQIGITAVASGTTLNVFLYTANGGVTNYTGDDTSGIYIWGAQLVQGASAGDYMQTGASTMATRYLDPFGSVYAKKLVENTATAQHVLIGSLAITANTVYTASGYFKAAERSRINFRLLNGAFNSGGYATFDVSTGTVVFSNTVGTGSSFSVAIIPAGDGWYRCSVSCIVDSSSTSIVWAMYLVNTGTSDFYTGDGTSGIYISGAQLSNSASLDSYVYNPTTALTSAAKYMPRFNYEVTDTVSPSRMNLLTYSEEFDESAWTKTRATVTANAITAPDGTSTADKLVEDSTESNSHTLRVTQSLSNVSYVFSVYAKAGERNWIRLVNASVVNSGVYFDLSAGVVGTVGASATASITSVGNGWFRCSVTSTAIAGDNSIDVRLADDDNGDFYTGDNTSGLYIWGAQLETGSTATDYIYSGATQGFVNAVMTTEAQGLLIEEQRTNLVIYSEQFENAAWTKADSSIVANTAVSPDGMLDADKLVENSVTAGHFVQSNIPTSTAGVSYTYSCYVKAAERTRAAVLITGMGSGDNGVIFDLTTGAFVVAINSPDSYSSVSLGNGWWRLSVTKVAATSSPFAGRTHIISNTSISYAGNGTSGIYIWGAQLEAGAFATSYIPTVASSVTRSADIATVLGRNFSSWYNQNEGTVYTDFQASPSDNTRYIDINRDGTVGNNNLYIDNASSNIRLVSYSAGTPVAVLGLGAVGTVGANNKIAAAYKTNDYSASRNGGSVVTDTSGDVPANLAQLRIGSSFNNIQTTWMNSCIKSINYWPTRLTNAQLQAITA